MGEVLRLSVVCAVCGVSACMCSVFVGRGWGVVIIIMQLDHLRAPTLQASLSGTLLQTLPDLVTPVNGALFISAQLSTDAVSALRKVRVLIRLWKQPSAQAPM